MWLTRMTPGVTCIAPSLVCCLPLMMPIMLLLLLCSWRKVHAVSCMLQDLRAAIALGGAFGDVAKQTM
jgi:hypothetical protein